jgi:hypothetical protein
VSHFEDRLKMKKYKVKIFYQLLPVLLLMCCRVVFSDAEFLWDNFSGAKNAKLISTTIRPASPNFNSNGFWGMFGVGSTGSEDLTKTETEIPVEPKVPENVTVEPKSPIDYLSNFANRRALQKLSQFVSDRAGSVSSPIPSPDTHTVTVRTMGPTPLSNRVEIVTSPRSNPDAQTDLVRRMGPAPISNRVETAASLRPNPDAQTDLVRRMGSAPVSNRRNDDSDDVETDIDVDVDDDVDGDRLVAQVTAVNVLSQVQKMQDEIQELNKEIEEENMKVKLKDLKKSMESEGGNLIEHWI